MVMSRHSPSALRLALRSPGSTGWTSVFRPEGPLRPGGQLEQGGSEREATLVWPDGDVFQRSGWTYLAAFVQLGCGLQPCA